MTQTLAWTWPRTWLAEVLPRRTGGGALGGTPPLPPEQPYDVGKTVDAWRGGLRKRLLDDGHEPGLQAAALETVDGPVAAWTPIGVAAALTLATNGTTMPESVVDMLLAEHGPEFAARTVAELAGIDAACVTRVGYRLVRFTGHPWQGWNAPVGWAGMARLLRIRLTTVSTPQYLNAATALGHYRRGLFRQRAVTSYLVPDARWVADDCADAASLGQLPDALLLFGAASTVEQFTQLGQVAGAGKGPTTVAGVATLLDVLGTGAVPVLARWARARYTRDGTEPIWTALTALPTDEAFEALATSASRRFAMPYVRRAMDRAPERALRVLAGLGGDLLHDHVVTRPDLAERMLPELPADAAARVRAVLPPAPTGGEVPAGDLPRLLHRPPWTVKRRVQPVTVAGLVAPVEKAMAWLPGERETWVAQLGPADRHPTPAELDSLVEGGRGRHGDLAVTYWTDEAFRPVLDRIQLPPREYDFQRNSAQWLLATRFGVDALPALLAVARRRPRLNLEPLLPFACGEVAAHMADWYDRYDKERATALAWFTRHPGVTARALVPPALGTAKKDRRQAERVLRLLAGAGFEADVRAAADGYGPDAVAGIDTLLRTDPLDVVPDRVPTLPAWLDARLLPPLRVPDGRALPVQAVGHACTVLAMSTLDEPHAGVGVVRATCDPGSLEAFGWAMFERWVEAGHPARERWVFTALGLVGSDATVERLVPVLAGWPRGGAQARAVLGLDVLRAIGTDKALIHLDRFTRKGPTPSVRSAAEQRIEAVAQARGLTPEQLADRLVPDLGLDPDGRLTLDYGPRRFVVGFDERLRPYTVDAAGTRRTTLPKPGARDDATAAPAAYARFTTLKRTVRAVAVEQLRRFERAMVWGRRFTAAELETLFLAHPLLRHLVRRLVWGVYDADGTVTGAFRIAEDDTYADAADDPYTVTGDSVIGVAHALHLGAAGLAAWTQTFADYEILQPFPQLGRETYASVEPLDRYLGRATTGGRALGLSSRGWELDEPRHRGRWYDVGLPGGFVAYIEFDPGMAMLAGFDPTTAQTVSAIGLNDGSEDVGFDRLDPVTRSEVLRDLTHVLG